MRKHNRLDICSEVLNKINERIPKESFDTWFQKTSMEIEDDLITIYVDNEFGKYWIEKQYSQLISEKVKEVTGKSYNIQYSCKSQELSKYPTNNFYPNQDSIINELLARIEQLETRISRLEARN